MEHYKNLTEQQLTLLAASSVLVGGGLLSWNKIVGACILGLAFAFGVGAFVKYRARNSAGRA
jgi:predicted membrane-bound spermidine synthase